jgi:hypothetical protein
VLLLITTLVCLAFTGVAHAKTEMTTCKTHLSWQRWDYTKAHYNVTQSLTGKAPVATKWSKPLTVASCESALKNVRVLRSREHHHWAILRLHRLGIRWIIRRQFSKAGDWAVAAAWKVASCESSYQPFRVSSTSDTGVWQINWVHHVPYAVMTSPEASTAWAWRASDHGTNFSPTWVCASNLGIA